MAKTSTKKTKKENNIKNDETINEEVLVSEQPTEDKKVENPSEKVEEKKDEPVKLVKFGEDETPCAEQVETSRKTIFEFYKKEKRVSRIAMIVAVGIIIAAIVLLSFNIPGAKIVAFILAGAVLLGLILYYVLTKNRFPNATKEYIAKVSTLLNRDSYAISELSNPEFNIKEKVEMNDILAEKVYAPIEEISSRNVIHAHYLKRPITISDIALYVSGQKKGSKQVVFLGKHISFENDFHFEGRYIFQLRTVADKANDTPTDISDLVIRYGGADYTVYGVEKSDYKKDIGQKFVDELRKIEVAGSLLNVNVVVWAGHTGVYLSYDDSVMSIPFEHEYKNDSHQLFNNHLKLVLKALKETKK